MLWIWLLKYFCSPKGKEAKAGGRSGKTTFWLWPKQTITPRHHTTIVSRTVRLFSHCQVWRVCQMGEGVQREQTGKMMLFLFAAEFQEQWCRITEILPDTTIIHQNYCTDKWLIFAIYWWFRSVPSVMDISGLATIPATPSRPPTEARPSQHVLKRPPLEGDYITVTDSSGNRVYLRQKEDAGMKVKQLICDSPVFFSTFSYYIPHVWFHVSPFLFLSVSRWQIPE